MRHELPYCKDVARPSLGARHASLPLRVCLLLSRYLPFLRDLHALSLRVPVHDLSHTLTVVYGSVSLVRLGTL